MIPKWLKVFLIILFLIVAGCAVLMTYLSVKYYPWIIACTGVLIASAAIGCKIKYPPKPKVITSGACASSEINMNAMDKSWCKGNRLNNKYSLLLHPDKNSDCPESSESLFKQGQSKCEEINKQKPDTYQSYKSSESSYSDWNRTYEDQRKKNAEFYRRGQEREQQEQYQQQEQYKHQNSSTETESDDITFDDIIGTLGILASGLGVIATGIGYGLFWTGATTISAIGYGLSSIGDGLYDFANDFHEGVASDFIK